MLKRTRESCCRSVKKVFMFSHEQCECNEQKPEDMVYINMLQACVNEKDLHKGMRIHAFIVNSVLLRRNPYVACSLINMYVKCGAFDQAEDVLERLPTQNVVAWNALISGYVKQDKGKDALRCFQCMKHHCISPDVITFICILKACTSLSDVDKGKEIHDDIVRKGLLENHIELGNALVDMYAKCGALSNARKLIMELRTRNVVTWSALIAGYAQEEMGEEALECFELMKDENISPDAITFSSVLKACGVMKFLQKGIEIHNYIIRNRISQDNNVLGTALVDMYGRCGALWEAQQVFAGLPVRSAVSWNALITGYSRSGLCEDALSCFNRMRCNGLCPDMVTFTSSLKACGSSGSLKKAKQIHAEVAGKGFMTKDIMIGTALVDAYAKCGALTEAHRLLDGLPVRNVVCWNALIAGYVHRGQGEEALSCFKRMHREGIPPDATTFSCILKGCSSIRAIQRGKQIHDELLAKGCSLGSNLMLATSLLDMYVKCGSMAQAEGVFCELSVRDVAAWNALIAGYDQSGDSDCALECFQRMQTESVTPDAITFSHIVKACGIRGDIKGKQIHGEVLNNKGLLLDEESNLLLGNALVEMYAKSGLVEMAQQVLDQLSAQDVASWSALISGYAFYGQCGKALDCFEKMRRKGTQPNEITFLSVLTACNHGGLVNEGKLCFARMNGYGMIPGPEHHACMVDIFGRAGQLSHAMAVIRKMPSSDYPPVWSALLCACRLCGNVELGRFAFGKAMQLDSNDVAAYVCMANLYALVGMQEEAERIMEMPRTREC